MSDFLNDIKKLSEAIKIASKWENSKTTISLVEEGSSDYIFEFYCYTRIVVDLELNYELEFIPGQEYPDKFPEKAGYKKNYPRFHLKDKKSKELVFQLCAGTLIQNEYPDQDLYPDISLQCADSPDQPSKEHLLMIWDAKHVSKEGDRIATGEIRHFAAIIDIYELNNKDQPNLLFSDLKHLKGNCLITNGNSHHKTNDESYLRDKKIKLIYQFNINTNGKSLG